MGIPLRIAQKSDIGHAVTIDNHSWPHPMWTSREQFLSRLKVFPRGFIVADNRGHIVGLITSMRTHRDRILKNLPPWRDVTDNGYIAGTHDPHGDCLFLLGVNVSPEIRGVVLGSRLVNEEINAAASLQNVESVLGYTRIPRYRRFAQLPVEEYIRKTRASGHPYDSVLNFHARNGAEILTPVKNGRPEDSDSLGYAVLISYDEKLKQLKKSM